MAWSKEDLLTKDEARTRFFFVLILSARGICLRSNMDTEQKEEEPRVSIHIIIYRMGQTIKNT